jgi:hypothetical protein
MKTTCALSILASLSLLAVPRPAASQQREVRDLAGFDGIRVGGGIDLHVRQGEPFLVEVEASSSGDADDIVTEVRNGTLEVRHDRSLFGFFDWGSADVAVHVTLPRLVELTASGGSDVRSEGRFSGEELELIASGGSDITIDAAVDRLEVQTSGGSDVRITGSARSASLQSSGGSDLDASGLAAERAAVHSSGGSDLSIEVRESLVARASGGSDISYSGNPPSVDVNASGGADVRPR